MTVREALDHYAAVHFLGTAPAPEGVEYTYSDRLRRMGDDQIARCIATLRADPEQRRAVAVTWSVGDPKGLRAEDDDLGGHPHDNLPSDAAGKNPPCLVMLWFRRDADGALFTHATFRSHDLYKAGVPNAWGLCRRAEHVAGELGWPVGNLAISSLSAHVYSQDWGAARTLAQERGRKVYEDDSERAILRVRGGALLAVDLLGPDGATRATIEGLTAEGVEHEVLEAGWVSTLSHAAWLGRELARAERTGPKDGTE